MRLVIFNGSPRNKASNSRLLIEQFLSGYTEIIEEGVPVHYLANVKKQDEAITLFQEAETAIIVFPLYTDSMPGIVKAFIEKIVQPNVKKPQKIGFVVHSGFPESYQSTFVARYTAKLASRLNCEYLGTVIKGGTEGVRIMPPGMTKKLFAHFRNLGKYFAEKSAFSTEIIEALALPSKLAPGRIRMMKIMSATGIGNLYWNSQLKKYNAFEKRFDAPYAEN